MNQYGKMKIAILSDIHDHVWNLKKALSSPQLQETETMLYCGDLCAPFIIHLLGQSYQYPIHLVFGNNDGDGAAIIKNASQYSQITIHGETFRGEIGGLHVAMNHYPDKARIMAENGGYDLVCYGHNHTLAQENIGNTLLINPGAIMGFHGGRLEDIQPTFAILDTNSKDLKVVPV